MSSASQPARVENAVFRFAVYELDVYARELRKFGTRIPLQQQPMQVLQSLVEHQGETVTRDELCQLLWAADTFVDFEHSLNSAVKKLRRALNDDPLTPKFIETIPRHGYRFVAPVTREEAKSARTEVAAAPVIPERERRWRWWKLAIVFGAVVVIGGTTLFLHRRTTKGVGAPINSVAVLPLQNLSRNPEQEYL